MKKVILSLVLFLVLHASTAFAYEPSTWMGLKAWSVVTVTATTAASVTLTYDGSFWFQVSGQDVYATVAPATTVVTPSTTLSVAGEIFCPNGSSTEFGPDYGCRAGNKITFICKQGTSNVSFLNKEYFR